MKLTEKTVRKNYLYYGKIINLRRDDALLPDGNPCIREMVEHSGGAAIICVNDGKILLVKQFRYAYQEEILEIPAGKLNEGEEPILAAQRELKEETGCQATLKPAFVLYPTPGYTNEKIYLFCAENAQAGEQKLDEGEFLNVEWMPLETAYQLLDEGKITDAKTVVALLYLKNK